MRSASAAVAYARRYTTYRTQYCLNFVQTMLGAPWSGPSAVVAWQNARGKHGPDPHPPPGVPIWILGSKYGHIALSTGGGKCRSTDYPSQGRVGEVGILELARMWGRTYVGWAEYLGGQKIPGVFPADPEPPAPAHPSPPPIMEYGMFIAKDNKSNTQYLIGPSSVLTLDKNTYDSLVNAGVPVSKHTVNKEARDRIERHPG